MLFLTNDDGYDALGLQAVARELRRQGRPFFVSAPMAEQSGVGHAITLHRPLRLRQIQGGIALDGTPTDAVYVGLAHLHSSPTLLISGINNGANLGNDLIYSGTIAAAHEGCLSGIPSIAVSLYNERLLNDTEQRMVFEKAAALLFSAVIPFIEKREAGHSGTFFYNVNIPAAGFDNGTPRIRMATLGKRLYGGSIVKRVDPRGKEYVWIGGDQSGFADIPGSDCNLIREGFVTVTPLAPDFEKKV